MIERTQNNEMDEIIGDQIKDEKTVNLLSDPN